MKVLRVIASLNPSSGGPCQGIRNAIPALKELGVYNEVVCLDDPKAKYIGTDPFTVNALGPANNVWTYAPKLKYWLKKNLDRFDVVIVHGLWLYHGYAVNLALEQIKGKRPKLYVMPHGMLDPYFQKAKSRKLKALRNWFYWKLIETKLIHNAEALLFTCEQEMLLARETFRPYHPKNEWNVGYGVPEPPSYNEDMSLKFLEVCPQVKGENYLLFLSRINEKKGVDLLIKAYLNFKKLYLNLDLPLLVIAGPGIDASYGEQIHQMVDHNHLLCDNVFFPGMLTGDAKWGAFYGADAFVLPSHQENFGIAVVEALACGKPVLISDQINIWKEIEIMNGGIVAPDTLEGTLELLKEWIRITPEDKSEMSRNARSIFHEKFSVVPNALKLKNAIS